MSSFNRGVHLIQAARELRVELKQVQRGSDRQIPAEEAAAAQARIIAALPELLDHVEAYAGAVEGAMT